MKHIIIGAALALSACGAPVERPNTASAVADTVVIKGTQGLIIASLVHQSIGTPVAVALESGLVPAPIKAQVKALDLVVINALRAGARTQDNALKAREAAKALEALTRISELTGIKIPNF